jgi:hypothetical protein
MVTWPPPDVFQEKAANSGDLRGYQLKCCTQMRRKRLLWVQTPLLLFPIRSGGARGYRFLEVPAAPF